MKKVLLLGFLIGILVFWSSSVLFDQRTPLDQISSIAQNGIKQKAYPGCQVLILKNGIPIYNQNFGTYTYESSQKVSDTTLYDLASLSKTTGTLLAVMKLYDEGKLHLTDSLALFLPSMQGTDKGVLTVEELLFHESGLLASLSCYNWILERNNTGINSDENTGTIQPTNPKYRFSAGWLSGNPSNEFSLHISENMYISNRFRDTTLRRLARIKLRSKTYVYSCINFILLKEVVESISRCPMDKYLDSVFFKPMGLKTIAYLPLLKHQKEEIAPTLKKDFLRKGVLQGYVHDPDAAFLGGVSGNAGLFASAWDVAMVHQMLLNEGELDGKRYLSTETCSIFTRSTSISGRRGLGFDKPVPSNPAHSPCCISAPKEVYGHTGYTGTCCWVDPINKVVYVFLSNRTYPNDGINKLAKMGIRTQIQELIYQSLK